MRTKSPQPKAYAVVLNRTIVHLRRRKAWSQDVLAARIGLSRTGYRNIERRPDLTSVETLTLIADELGEPVWKLLKFAGAKEKEHSTCHS